MKKLSLKINYIAILLSCTFISVLATTNMRAQTKSKTDTCYAGVYLTYNDFFKKHLSHKINTKSKGNNFDFVLASKTIKIITRDTTVKFKPGSIFGFYDCRDLYRYSPDVELLSPEDYYKIEEMGSEESGKLIIYTSVFKGGKEYFFSTGLNYPIHRLNMNHLEKDFKGLFPKFIEAVKKIMAENAGDIAAKDSIGHFLINKLYQQYVIH